MNNADQSWFALHEVVLTTDGDRTLGQRYNDSIVIAADQIRSRQVRSPQLNSMCHLFPWWHDMVAHLINTNSLGTSPRKTRASSL